MEPKILLVDDEPDIIAMAKFCLQRAGYAVITADNGESGLQCALTEQPDAVILDVMMPVMDGFEVLRRLKEHPSTAYIPVMMLSARDRYADLAKGQQHGCDFYCTKPFTPSELVSLVRRLLAVGSGR